MAGYIVKLVRDRIGERIGPARAFEYRPTQDRAEHLRLLRAKLAEEMAEYLLAEDSAERAGELADILDVARALAYIDVHDATGMLTPEQAWRVIESISEQKRRERGGFVAGTVMVASDWGPEGLADG